MSDHAHRPPARHTQRHVVISRQWHAPAITVNITEDGITVVMPLDDFVSALAEEAVREERATRGQTLLPFGQGKRQAARVTVLRARIVNAAHAVMEGMKHVTAAVM